MSKKKIAVSASAIMLGISILAGGTVMAAPSGNYIGSEKAKQIALENAGLAEGDVTFARIHLDYDDGYPEYEVEFYQGNMEYDYDIDAINGTILSYDYDAEYYSPTAGIGAAAAGTDYISSETAKQAALNHAGVAESDTRRMEIGFDYEHGLAVYDVEWKVGWTEYSYEINASTGEVVSYEMEYDD